MIPRSRTFRIFVFALAAVGLYACMENDKPASPAHENKATGSARVQLPSLPAGYLAKTGAGSGVQALFALTITGSGMAPIQQSWYLTSGQAQSAYIGGIPAGNLRVFTGRLIRFDSAAGDTTVTHEGSDSVAIQQDSITEVNLFLHRSGNGGGAHVCVDVEGWPSDSTCIRPPIIVPQRAWFAGCWNVLVTKQGATPRQDSIFRTKLRIEQWDTSLIAFVTWNNGATDSAFGYVDGRGTALIGYRGGEFMINAELDSGLVDTTFNRRMHGWFNDSARGVYGPMTASQAACDTVIIEPPIDSSFGPACFSVSQTPTGKKAVTGTLVLAGNGSNYWGAFNWKGYPEMYVSGEWPLNGSLDDTAAIALHGFAPRGLVDTSAADTVMYRAVLKPGAATFGGNVFALARTGWKSAGTWKGNRKACVVQDTLR
jgi:hypothetical protein